MGVVSLLGILGGLSLDGMVARVTAEGGATVEVDWKQRRPCWRRRGGCSGGLQSNTANKSRILLSP